jgi:hypothetical protein
MTESFTLDHSTLLDAAGRGKGPGRFETVASLDPDGPDRIVRGVVGIFSLSSHPVIIIIMLWTRWTVVLAAAPPAG